VFRTPEQLENTAFDAWRSARRMSHLTQGISDRATNSRSCIERCSYTEACLAGRKGMDEVAFMEATGYTVYDHNAKDSGSDEAEDELS
jgi:hypothetical protein